MRARSLCLLWRSRSNWYVVEESYYMGRDGRAVVVTGFYIVVMKYLLCFSLLLFAAWLSPYHMWYVDPLCVPRALSQCCCA